MSISTIEILLQLEWHFKMIEVKYNDGVNLFDTRKGIIFRHDELPELNELITDPVMLKDHIATRDHLKKKIRELLECRIVNNQPLPDPERLTLLPKLYAQGVHTGFKVGVISGKIENEDGSKKQFSSVDEVLPN